VANRSVHRNRIVDLDGVRIDVASRVLLRDGRRIRMQEQPFRVLEMLLDRPGELVTREALRDALWPHKVHIDFEHGLNNAIARLREALGDDRAEPRFIETVPRRGYRFIHPLAVAAGRQAEPADRLSNERDAAGRLRIAVLPFMDVMADGDGEHFGDGLAEALVDRLAKADGIDVVARLSAHEFDGDRDSSAAIAAALAVDQYLDGRVWRSDGQVRIVARLVDARTGRDRWSHTFHPSAGDAIVGPDEMARAVAAALQVTIDESVSTQPIPAEADRLYRIARAHLLGRARNADLDLARRSLDQAIALAPRFAAAYAALAGYHFRFAMSSLADADVGERTAALAVEIDPESSEAWQQLANFTFVRARRNGDYVAYLAGQEAMQRAIALDPGNSGAFQDYGRAVLWHEPHLALRMLERASQLEMLCTYPLHLAAIVRGSHGDLQSARSLRLEARRREPDENVFTMALGTLETYFGDFTRAVPLLRSVESIGGAARVQLWSIYLSMADLDGAFRCLDFGRLPFERPLSEAARMAMQDDFTGAYQVLEAGRQRLQPREMLDAPTAKFALIAGDPWHALELLTRRWPDLAAGVEPICARNVMPAIDLATARTRTGQHDGALCSRIATFLDGPHGLTLPMFSVQRARLHGLLDEVDAACDALDHAYEGGLRTLWALDLRPHSDLYIDPLVADPVFDELRSVPRFRDWLERVSLANAGQREALRQVS